MSRALEILEAQSVDVLSKLNSLPKLDSIKRIIDYFNQQQYDEVRNLLKKEINNKQLSMLHQAIIKEVQSELSKGQYEEVPGIFNQQNVDKKSLDNYNKMVRFSKLRKDVGWSARNFVDVYEKLVPNNAVVVNWMVWIDWIEPNIGNNKLEAASHAGLVVFNKKQFEDLMNELKWEYEYHSQKIDQMFNLKLITIPGEPAPSPGARGEWFDLIHGYNPKYKPKSLLRDNPWGQNYDKKYTADVTTGKMKEK